MFDLANRPGKTTPSHIAFTGNPIIMRDNDTIPDQPVSGYPFEIVMNGIVIYSGRFNYPHVINVADIINAYVKKLPEPDDVVPMTFGPLKQIENEAQVACREVFVAFNGEYKQNMGFIALPGGISKQNFRRMESDRDIFTERFCAVGTNCFLTTRTVGWRIFMKETEIYPLYFINDERDDVLMFVEKVTGMSWTIDGLKPGIYALDVEALRLYFFENYEVLVNNFDIYHRGKFACSLVIGQADPSRDRYRLKFRNSLGVFEIIEITGEMSIKPQWESAEGAIFKRYDEKTADYISYRDRIERKQKISVQTGVKSPDETQFLMDMLASDEVYLLGLTSLPARVIPSTEDFVYMPRSESPQSFAITLELADAETNILQEFINGTECHKQRVFSKQFNNLFN